jgi:hypothetical protein
MLSKAKSISLGSSFRIRFWNRISFQIQHKMECRSLKFINETFLEIMLVLTLKGKILDIPASDLLFVPDLDPERTRSQNRNRYLSKVGTGTSVNPHGSTSLGHPLSDFSNLPLKQSKKNAGLYCDPPAERTRRLLV